MDARRPFWAILAVMLADLGVGCGTSTVAGNTGGAGGTDGAGGGSTTCPDQLTTADNESSCYGFQVGLECRYQGAQSFDCSCDYILDATESWYCVPLSSSSSGAGGADGG